MLRKLKYLKLKWFLIKYLGWMLNLKLRIIEWRKIRTKLIYYIINWLISLIKSFI